MKILHIEDEPWDSGIAHYALTLCAELRSRGHEVHLWGRAGSPLLEAAARLSVSVRGLKRPWLSLSSLRSDVRRSGVELINAHTGSGHALAAALAAGTKTPVIRTRGDTRAAARHPLAHFLARRTRAFIAANSAIGRELSDSFPGSEIVTVFQGIAAGPALPLPESGAFGILGRLDPVKGHETFIEAAALVCRDEPQARFRAVGAGSMQRRAILEARGRRLGLEGHWDFTGFVDDVPAELARCRVGVVASRGSEAVSRAALEWMAAGRPVIATSVGCLPDLVADGETGLLVPPDNPRAMAQALLRLLRDPSSAARMGAVGRRRFETRFSLKPFGDETIKFYHKVLAHDV